MTGMLLCARAVDGAVPKCDWPTIEDENGKLKSVPPSVALNNVSTGLTVEGATWWPGQPQEIRHCIVGEHGVQRVEGTVTFNLYRAPPDPVGDATMAGPWLKHLERLYPEEAPHLIRYFAHAVQRPGEKPNHGVVLGGKPGIGKDTLLKPVIAAIGQWNVANISPRHLRGSFNGWAQCVLLVLSEAHDLGDADRYSLYEQLKTLTAAPPETIRVNAKHLREYAIPNILRVVATTNHVDGLYLSPDDRRFLCCWAILNKDELPPGYFVEVHSWLENGGYGHVAKYLAEFDLSDFNPKAAPPRTAARARMVDAGHDPSLTSLDDLLCHVGRPEAITLEELIERDFDAGVKEILSERKHARRVPHLMAESGYVKALNRSSADGRFKIKGRNRTIYVLESLSPEERLAAVDRLRDRLENGR